MSARIGHLLLFAAAAYGACTLHVVGEGPVDWVSALAATVVARASVRQAMTATVVLGLLRDALSPMGLGPHLAVYTVLAALMLTLVADVSRHHGLTSVWFAGLFAAGTSLPEGLLSRGDVPFLSLLHRAAERGVGTAAGVLTCVLLAGILRRLCAGPPAAAPLALSNRWKMLTE
uniref:FUSC family protein n=1 Tax=Schlesneria paludicola TaxID=360056 RepID=A0A7C4LN42_9PLAN